ncbi:MAG TPA: right-handed parallel beta-helix repeat-containing protein [Verrucomicrobiae bacterium]|nr:right-handed parallel beta-helix repeat-containing protein [Verrucomicrobiae bacterium]
MKKQIIRAYLAIVIGALVDVSIIGSTFADTKVVDPAGGGDYTTIQAAVSDLPNPGPRTIIVRAGTYHEAVLFSAENTRAINDGQRIILMGDTNAAPGSVVVIPPPGSSGVSLNQSRFISVQGLAIAGVKGAKVAAIKLSGGSENNQDITIVGCLIHDNAGHGIEVQAGNPRTWIMNNLIHGNGSNVRSGQGILVADGLGETIYVVNNTIVRNASDGAYFGVPRPFYAINNLVVDNGGYGFRRTDGLAIPTRATLLNNMFYANRAGDLANISQTMDDTDTGNRTTTGQEGIGVSGCTFPNCNRATALTALFVDPGTAADFHLAAGSPAIDSGVNSFSDGTDSWAIMDDLDGNARPQDGRGDCLAMVDIGCYEAPAVPCQSNAIPSLASLLFGNGGLLVSNVNAQTLGGVNAADYATVYGTYLGMTVGTATNALNLGDIPPGGYVRTNDARVVNAITALYATGGGTVTVNGNVGTINFAAATTAGTATFAISSGYATNAGVATSAGTAAYASSSAYATNAGSAVSAAAAGTATFAASSGYAATAGYATNAGVATTAGGAAFATSSAYATNAGSALSAATAGTATFAISSGYATNAGAAPVPALSNVLAVGNITGTGIVFSADDSTGSYGVHFADGSGNTNQFFGSSSNLEHVAPTGATGTVWDALNLPYPASTNGNYAGMSVGSATFAAGAGNASFAESASVSSNTLQLGGIGAAAYSTSNQLTATSNTLAAAALAITNGLPTTAITNGLVSATVTNGLATPSVTNGLETIVAANALSNALAAATALKLDITATNSLASVALLASASNTLAAATLAITNGLETITTANALSNALASATLVVTNGLATPTVTNGLQTITTANALSNTLAVATALKLDITGTNSLASVTLLASASNTLATATLAITNGLPTTAITNGLVSGSITNGLALTTGTYIGLSVGTATYAVGAGTASAAANSGYATNAGTATFATTAGSANSAGTASTAVFSTSAAYATNAGTAGVAVTVSATITNTTLVTTNLTVVNQLGGTNWYFAAVTNELQQWFSGEMVYHWYHN